MATVCRASSTACKAELQEMAEEHKIVLAAFKTLSEAAMKENKMEYANFAEKLMLHAQTEEEVSYPTAILIGEYVKLKLNKLEFFGDYWQLSGTKCEME
jgi:hypothetical protein